MKTNILWLSALFAALFLTSCSAEETTYLHESAKQGNLTQVQGLLESGAAIDAKDGFQRPALHWAVNRGFAEVARHLVERGTSPNSSSNTARTSTRKKNPGAKRRFTLWRSSGRNRWRTCSWKRAPTSTPAII